MAAMVLAACGCSKNEKLPVSDDAYAEYVGAQFAGQDPWGGELTITVRSIVDGKMDWTFTDSFEDHTLYQEQSETAVQNGSAEYSIQGEDAENDDVSFSYEGTMGLSEGQITFRFLKGSVTANSSDGDSDARIAEALEASGISSEVVLVKTADDSLTTYTAQEGDSIHSIAEQYGISTKELAILNQTVIIETAQAYGHQFDDVIEYAKYLFPGEELAVPKKTSASLNLHRDSAVLSLQEASSAFALYGTFGMLPDISFSHIIITLAEANIGIRKKARE